MPVCLYCVHQENRLWNRFNRIEAYSFDSDTSQSTLKSRLVPIYKCLKKEVPVCSKSQHVQYNVLGRVSETASKLQMLGP